MRFIIFLAKILVILLSVALVAAPFAFEFLEFRQDKKRKISHKRLRYLVYTFCYLAVVTIILCAMSRVLLDVKSIGFVKWMTDRLAVAKRIKYISKVLATLTVNFTIGVWFVVLKRFVRVGLAEKELEKPLGENGKFKLKQIIERKIIRFFNTETWFFVGEIFKYFNIAVSAMYAVIFIVYLIPCLFGAGWIPYKFIQSVFSTGYLYPVITLLGTWEIYYFLKGIQEMSAESAQNLNDENKQEEKKEVSLEAIDAEVKKQFKDFYVCDVELSEKLGAELSIFEHNPITEYIRKAVENDSRTPGEANEAYMNCIDKMVESDDSILINGNFFSNFSAYFFRYISIILARGDNVVFVCNSNLQAEDVYNYIKDGLSQISSVYYEGTASEKIDFDNPIWKIVKVSGKYNMIEKAAITDAGVLVTTLDYLCSKEFETEATEFIHLLDTVVFVGTSETVNLYNRQLAALNTRLRHITKNNANLSKNSKKNPGFKVRYMSKDVRYICFDDTRSPGLDKVLKNMLGVRLLSVDSMHYSPKTLVRCYNYEARKDENGQFVCPQFLNTEEKIDTVMNMAFLCLACGADTVDVFVDGNFPFDNISESVAANKGQIVIDADVGSIRVNKHSYSSEGCNVVIALDTGDNLPVALRRYISMISGKSAYVIVLSRPYMLRDYYLENISDIWRSNQLIRIPVEEGTKKDVAGRIVVKANAGGISEEEILHLASGVPQLDRFVKARDINAILRSVLESYGIPQEDRIDLFKYFEYVTFRDFDENGVYCHNDRVLLRRQGKAYAALNGSDNAVIIIGENEIPLPISRQRISQKYIAGQNLIHEGNIYYIQSIDNENGKIYAKLSVAGKNEEAYQYVQKREYHLEFLDSIIEMVYTPKHVVFNRSENNISVNDIYVSVFKTPMEVITKGYYTVDPQRPLKNPMECEYYSISDEGNDILAKQTYRRYGKLLKPAYSAESVMKDTSLNASDNEAQVMALRFTGSFGDNPDKVISLAAVMLGEVLHAMFPSVADEVVVCPVIFKETDSSDAATALQMQPRLIVDGVCPHIPEGDFNLLIIEDSDTDLGVISVLMSAGDDIIKTLFAPVAAYLSWYISSERKSTYLYSGLDREPDCFDFAGLAAFSKLVSDSKQNIRFVDVETIVEYADCDFCGQRCQKGTQLLELTDGRKICKTCQGNIVGDDSKTLAEYLNRARMFLESTYGVSVGNEYTIKFEPTRKIVNTLAQNTDVLRPGFDIPLKSYVDNNKVIHIESTIPSVSLSELIIRELTYIWQVQNVASAAQDLKNGHMALVAIQYLRFLNDHTLADARTSYYESTGNVSGEGYRRLARILLENKGYMNNPFRCLIGICENNAQIPAPKPRSEEPKEYGKPYVPVVPDRSFDGSIKYFYYSRLSDSLKAVYDVIVSAIIEFRDNVTIDGVTFEQLCVVSEAVSYDRPELFWYETLSVCGNSITLNYCSTKEEAAAVQKRIDEAVPKFLEGIDDSMSAYDVALRVHERLMMYVDYDTVALNKEAERKGDVREIDYIRTICGVFINQRAVCAGYAHAATYLLQKCGIECGFVPGHARNDDGSRGEGHAWNIVKIDGEYYYLDITWDDRSNTIQTVKRTDTGFDYFCVTTEEMERTHCFDLCIVDMPVCSAIKANYYYHNDLLIDNYDIDRIVEIAGAAAQSKCKYFTLKCKSAAVYEQAFSKLIVENVDSFKVLSRAAKSDKRIDSSKYTYTYDKKLRTITVNFKYKNS